MFKTGHSSVWMVESYALSVSIVKCKIYIIILIVLAVKMNEH